MRRLTLALTAALIAFGLHYLPAEVQRREVGNLVLENVPEIPASLMERMNQYHNVRSASFSDWVPDGGGLLISTRFGNTSQLHRVEGPMGARFQITYFDDAVTSGKFGPEGVSNLILFTKGRDGDERHQIFTYDTLTGQHRMISDGFSVHRSVAWANKSPMVGFSNNARNGRDWDLYVQPVLEGPDSRRMVFEGEGAWSVSDWSADDSRLLISNYISASESSLHILNLATGETRKVHPEISEGVAYRASAFSKDSDGVFYTSDHRQEFQRLYYYDPVHNVSKTLLDEVEWDVENFALSEDGRLMALSVNEGGFSAVYLLNLKTLEKERLGIPQGVVSGLKFRQDGERIAFSLYQSTSPGDVYTWKRAERELVRWTRSEVGGIPPEQFIETEIMHYPTFDNGPDGRQRMIPALISRPRTPGPWPVLIDIHGGPESQRRPFFTGLQQFLLVEMGVAMIEPNVRGSTGYGRTYQQLDDGMLREDSVKDIGALLDWIATQPEFDASRVVVRGGSYGGYMALASLAMFPDKLAGGMSFVGISNFVTFLETTSDYRQDLRRAEYGDERDPEMREFLESISPTNNAHKITAPLLVSQGRNDPRVPHTESEQIVETVRQNGQEVWYFLALNEGHGFARKENRDVHQAAMVLFLEKVLGIDATVEAGSVPELTAVADE